MNTQPIEVPVHGQFYGSRQQERAAYRSSVKVTPVKSAPIHTAVKLARKLESLPLLKVASYRQRFARKASTASHLLRRLDPDSPFTRVLESSVRGNVCCAEQCSAELQARHDHATKLRA